MSDDKNIMSLNDKVLKFLEQKKLAELNKPPKKAKKQPEQQPDKVTKKQKLIIDLIKKAKQVKFPLDKKEISKMCVRKIQQFSIFLDEYTNKEEKKREELTEEELKEVKNDLKNYVEDNKDDNSPKTERADSVDEDAKTEILSPDIQSIDDNLIMPPENLKLKVYNNEYLYKLCL